jgi:hypothetical protein
VRNLVPLPVTVAEDVRVEITPDKAVYPRKTLQDPSDEK